jgi:hypothetical protein
VKALANHCGSGSRESALLAFRAGGAGSLLQNVGLCSLDESAFDVSALPCANCGWRFNGPWGGVVSLNAGFRLGRAVTESWLGSFRAGVHG